MRKLILFILLSTLLSDRAFCQAQTRRLPNIINHPSLHVMAPYMSFDGNALLFVSNNGQDGALIVSYTSRENDWSEPVEIPKHLTSRLSFLKGFALTADGKRMYFTSAKSPVVGGYDIFFSDLKGSTWSAPENLMAPVNSRANEGCPSISADGNTLYFMRCDRMDQQKAEACKIFQTKKKTNGQWSEPVELPAHINAGNSQTPRIMADGETLLFSSDKFPGNKGGMDLYITTFTDGTWSAPRALDFVNTDKDDQYVSVNALGRYLIKEARGSRNNLELTEFLIPQTFRPKGLMKVEGKVVDDNGRAIPAYLSVTDLNTKKRVYSGRPLTDGSFFFYLTEGAQYELSVDPEESELSFFAKLFDLTGDKITQKEKVNVTLRKPAIGDELLLELVQFAPYSSNLTDIAQEELKRLARLLKSNPSFKAEIQVMLSGYRESYERDDTDLTEEEVVTSQGTTPTDTANAVAVESQRVLYHNNRTTKQAETIAQYLVKEGVNGQALNTFVNAIPSLEGEEKKLVVKIVFRR